MLNTYIYQYWLKPNYSNECTGWFMIPETSCFLFASWRFGVCSWISGLLVKLLALPHGLIFPHIFKSGAQGLTYTWSCTISREILFGPIWLRAIPSRGLTVAYTDGSPLRLPFKIHAVPNLVDSYAVDCIRSSRTTGEEWNGVRIGWGL